MIALTSSLAWTGFSSSHCHDNFDHPDSHAAQNDEPSIASSDNTSTSDSFFQSCCEGTDVSKHNCRECACCLSNTLAFGAKETSKSIYLSLIYSKFNSENENYKFDFVPHLIRPPIFS